MRLANAWSSRRKGKCDESSSACTHEATVLALNSQQHGRMDGFAGPDPDFHWVDVDDPHATRRKLILAKYPQVAKLYVKEPRTCLITLAYVATQLFIARWLALSSASWLHVLGWSYIVSGTINGALNLVLHELTHNLCFHSEWANRLLAWIAVIPSGVPSAVSFARYHRDHHLYQGTIGLWEAHLSADRN